MDTTEQCNAVISHFNGKFIKMAPGALGRRLWGGREGGGWSEGWSFFFSLFNLIVTKLVTIKC